MQARKLRHLTGLHRAASAPGGSASPVGWLDPQMAASALEKPPELTWRDHAVMLLHVAAAIEHALMVQYLFAAYSLGGEQVPPAHHAMVERWRDNILAVAKEEMGHLLTVQNVLALLGGPVSLDREDYPWDSPFYPAPFALAPLTLDTLALYVYAEMPEEWQADDKDEIIGRALRAAVSLGGSSRPEVNRVGVIYQTLITILADHRHIPDGAFQSGSLTMQASWDEWGRGYRAGARNAEVIVDRVATRDEVLAALHRIASQGESPDAVLSAFAGYAEHDKPPAALRLERRLRYDAEKTEAGAETARHMPSHFARFLDIYREFAAVAAEGWTPARNVPRNPVVTPQDGCTTIADPASSLWANLFNLRYRMLLVYLSHTLLLARQREDTEQPSVRGAVQHRIFAEMYNLKALAGILVRRPLGGADGQYAGPPFQMPYTLDLPAVARDRWLLHKELIAEARRLKDRLLRLSAGGPLSRDEAGYLAAMADADHRTETWLDRLLEARERRGAAA